jgi:(p)ppGpp synthase/HD superfamily hydrolase
MNLILEAAKLAAAAHAPQRRKWSNRPYIDHPGRVAARVSTLTDVTEEEVAVAWLHDVIEDCDPVYNSIIEHKFPERVYQLVMELTTPKYHPSAKRKERKEADRERLSKASRWAKSIKLVDRIDNLRDMTGAESGFQSLYLQESILLGNALLDYTDPVNKSLYLELMREIGDQTRGL